MGPIRIDVTDRLVIDRGRDRHTLGSDLACYSVVLVIEMPGVTGGNIETDFITAVGCVGVEDGLAQRAVTAVGGSRHGERVGSWRNG